MGSATTAAATAATAASTAASTAAAAATTTTAATSSSSALPRGALVLLCGLPAAGKSTLARRLLEVGPAQLRRELGVPSVRVWHLSFDAVLARLQAASGASAFDPELWHAAREQALKATRAHCSSSSTTTTSSSSSSSSPPPQQQQPPALAELASCATDGDGTAPFDLLVLDDNMHYRSMRKAYYRVARDAGFGLCTLCLPVDVETALARDASRPAAERVGRTTITMMRETLQWPDLDRHPWEQRVITLQAPPAPLDEPRLWRELASAVCTPVQAEAATRGGGGGERLAQTERDAQRTAESALHQFDLRLRKVIAEHMQSEPAQRLPGKERAALGKVLSERKKDALQTCRQHVQRAAPTEAIGEAVEEVGAEDEEERLDATVDALEHQFALLLRPRETGTETGDGGAASIS